MATSIGLSLLLSSVSSFAQDNNKLQISGFARLVAGYLDESDAEYLDYKDGLELGSQSLIGLQADYQISDTLSVSGQLLGHSNNNRNSGVEWAYLDYRPTKALQFKLGKLRSPFFNYSDVYDVGFAYPWVNLPQPVYSSYMFSNITGALASYEWVGKELAVSVEGYWGEFDDDYNIVDVDLDLKVDDLRGVISNVRYENWDLRAAFHQGDIKVDLPSLSGFSQLLEQSGFVDSALSLRLDGPVKFYQLGLGYETLDYFFKAEWTRIKSTLITVPKLRSQYASLGYNFHPFSVYATYASSKANFDAPLNEIPIGIDPQLDALAFGYRAIFDSLFRDSLDSLSVGARWDWQTNIALKAEITFLDAEKGERGFFRITDPQNFDGEATLYQVALEWVF